MGNNAPSSNRIEALIQYAENLWPHWNSTPTKYGTTASTVNQVKLAVQNARAAFDGAAAARQAAKEAAVGQDKALKAMKQTLSPVVNTIKAFIEASGDESLWEGSGLQPPAPRGTVPPPNAPTDLRAVINQQGEIEIRWKSRQPAGAQGTVFVIFRSVNDGDLTQLDTVGGKSFTDENLPAGTRTVTYAIKAKRSSKTSGFSGNLFIRLARDGSMMSQKSVNGPVKMAA